MSGVADSFGMMGTGDSVGLNQETEAVDGDRKLRKAATIPPFFPWLCILVGGSKHLLISSIFGIVGWLTIFFIGVETTNLICIA